MLSSKFWKILNSKLFIYICMPIFLACICSLTFVLVFSAKFGNPLKYIEVLKATSLENGSDILDKLFNVYDLPAQPPILIDPDNPDNSHNSGDSSSKDPLTPNNPTNPEDTDKLPSVPTKPNPDNPQDGPNIENIVFPGYNTKYGIFEIPKINVKYDLYFGDSYTVLDAGVGQDTGSYIPGYGGTTLLCTHNNKVKGLTKLEKGDEIKITTLYGEYIYKVTKLEIVHKNTERAYAVSKDNNDLKFYTCYPLDKPSGATQRLFVCAELVSGKMIRL